MSNADRREVPLWVGNDRGGSRGRFGVAKPTATCILWRAGCEAPMMNVVCWRVLTRPSRRASEGRDRTRPRAPSLSDRLKLKENQNAMFEIVIPLRAEARDRVTSDYAMQQSSFRFDLLCASASSVAYKSFSCSVSSLERSSTLR